MLFGAGVAVVLEEGIWNEEVVAVGLLITPSKKSWVVLMVSGSAHHEIATFGVLLHSQILDEPFHLV